MVSNLSNVGIVGIVGCVHIVCLVCTICTRCIVHLTTNRATTQPTSLRLPFVGIDGKGSRSHNPAGLHGKETRRLRRDVPCLARVAHDVHARPIVNPETHGSDPRVAHGSPPVCHRQGDGRLRRVHVVGDVKHVGGDGALFFRSWFLRRGSLQFGHFWRGVVQALVRAGVEVVVGVGEMQGP